MTTLRRAKTVKPTASEETTPPRFAEERQSAIADALRRTGRVEVSALASLHGVSEDSIRRDLRVLAARGLVQKTHGGAISLHVGAMEAAQRAEVMVFAKSAIGRAAAAKVQAHQSIFVDSGTTALAVARELCAAGAPRPLTIITASIDVAWMFSGEPAVKLVLAGGEWAHDTRSFFGPQTEATIRSHRADWAFLGACAVHPRLGLSCSQVGDAQTKRAMLASSVKCVLLADASKFDLIQPELVAELSQMDLVITDSAPDWLVTMALAVECV
jgi:DeoR/GlpR family transcriptional regulator of sugar metabolism